MVLKKGLTTICPTEHRGGGNVEQKEAVGNT